MKIMKNKKPNTPGFFHPGEVVRWCIGNCPWILVHSSSQLTVSPWAGGVTCQSDSDSGVEKYVLTEKFPSEPDPEQITRVVLQYVIFYQIPINLIWIIQPLRQTFSPLLECWIHSPNWFFKKYPSIWIRFPWLICVHKFLAWTLGHDLRHGVSFHLQLFHNRISMIISINVKPQF